MMKPLLVIPPAPSRWSAVQALLDGQDAALSEDLDKRLRQGVAGAQDAFALIADGGNVLACANICKRHDVGVLQRLFVRPDHRRRGCARLLAETVLSWFDMTGGKWLYATTTAEFADGVLARFGFQILRRSEQTPEARVVVARATDDAAPDPLATASGAYSIHDVTRANWPTLVTLLVNRPGPDPRLSLDESALQAEESALEFIRRQEAGGCQLKAAFHGPRLVGLATVAFDRTGDRTHAMIAPYGEPLPRLRESIIELARARGYEHVDFPMEALAPAPPKPRPPESTPQAAPTADAGSTPETPASAQPAPAESDDADRETTTSSANAPTAPAPPVGDPGI